MIVTVPPVNVQAVDGNGRPTREYNTFFRALASGLIAADGINLDDVNDRLDRIEAEIADSTTGNIQGADSIQTQGILPGYVYVTLQGDIEQTPALSFYGAITAGERGWKTYSANFAALDNGDGTSSLDLVDLTDAGTGSALVKITRDGKGRISGTEAATTTDLTEGANLYFTAARVRATVLVGLSLVTSAVIAATDTVLGALGKLQAQITDNLLPPGYIDGLKMVWMSGTALTVTTGAAYVPSLDKVLRATADITKTGLSLSASTWYHVYFYDNAGTPDIELSTVGPAATYNGAARTKTGDTSRRYVGSVKTNAASSILNFGQIGTYIAYRNFQGGSPFRVLVNGTALTETSVSLSGCVPSTSTLAMVRVINTAGTGNGDAQVYTGTSNDSAAGPPTSGIITVDPSKDGYVMHPLDDSQAMTYWYRAAGVGGGGAYMDVYGYAFER